MYQEPTSRASAHHSQILKLAVSLTIALTAGLSTAPLAQDLTSPGEMVLQGDSLIASGRPCLAAERYRAVVGEVPGVFLRYARARAACLEKNAEREGD